MTVNPDEGHVAKIRSAGFFTKGVVYVLIGALTFMAAFGLGGDITSTDGVVNFLLELPLGKILGGIVALGLIAYSLWRIYQMLVRPGKPNKKSKDWKDGFTRFRYFYSAIFYGIIAYSFAKPLIKYLMGEGGGGPSENSTQQKAALGELLANDWGKMAIWVLAAIIAAQAVWQFKLAYSGKFMKKIDNYPDIKHEYDFIRKSGRLGYSARGLVFGIISYFLVMVILQHNAQVYKGTEGALQYMLSFSYGSILLGITALGLIGYGVFNIMVARHANLTTIR
ncbi:DUF1206 domain-containing protein [Salinimicrobium gaetbulicola]|uniref:DUF1206 domain-containing protein n=1 Tax=Salinimicrobium gaetbulicola TaxID=999702 RepID=A0ABW3IH50_9FLAO